AKMRMATVIAKKIRIKEMKGSIKVRLSTLSASRSAPQCINLKANTMPTKKAIMDKTPTNKPCLYPLNAPIANRTNMMMSTVFNSLSQEALYFLRYQFPVGFSGKFLGGNAHYFYHVLGSAGPYLSNYRFQFAFQFLLTWLLGVEFIDDVQLRQLHCGQVGAVLLLIDFRRIPPLFGSFGEDGHFRFLTHFPFPALGFLQHDQGFDGPERTQPVLILCQHRFLDFTFDLLF